MLRRCRGRCQPGARAGAAGPGAPGAAPLPQLRSGRGPCPARLRSPSPRIPAGSCILGVIILVCDLMAAAFRNDNDLNKHKTLSGLGRSAGAVGQGVRQALRSCHSPPQQLVRDVSRNISMSACCCCCFLWLQTFFTDASASFGCDTRPAACPRSVTEGFVSLVRPP